MIKITEIIKKMINLVKNNTEKKKTVIICFTIAAASLFAVNAEAVENAADKISTAVSSFKSKGTFVYDKDGDGNAEIVLDSSDLKIIESKVNNNDLILDNKIGNLESNVMQKITELNTSVDTKIQNINTTVNNSVTNKLKGLLAPDETKGENGLVYDKTNGTYTLYLKTIDSE